MWSVCWCPVRVSMGYLYVSVRVCIYGISVCVYIYRIVEPTVLLLASACLDL